MKDDLRTRFRKAIDMQNRGETRSAIKGLDARQEFESAFEFLIPTVIAPALNELAHDLLRPAGWICTVSRAIEGTGVIFTIYRADESPRSNTRPSVSFLADRTLTRMWVQCLVRGMSQSIGIFKLGEVSNDTIQEKVLEFFQEL